MVAWRLRCFIGVVGRTPVESCRVMIEIFSNWQFSVAQVVMRQRYGYSGERCGVVSFNKIVVVFGCIVVVGVFFWKFGFSILFRRLCSDSWQLLVVNRRLGLVGEMTSG